MNTATALTESVVAQSVNHEQEFGECDLQVSYTTSDHGKPRGLPGTSTNTNAPLKSTNKKERTKIKPKTFSTEKLDFRYRQNSLKATS